MTFWRPSTNSAGYRGIIPEAGHPGRETALALVAAYKSDEWETTRELERLASKLVGFEIEYLGLLSDACHMVYGYPELSPDATAQRFHDVYLRPRSKATQADSREQPTAPQEGTAASSNGNPAPPTPPTPSALPDPSYGLGRRA